MFVIISKKKYKKMQDDLKKLNNRVDYLEERFKQHSTQQVTNLKEIRNKIAEIDEKASKKYVSDNFSKDKEKPKSWNQIMDEYLNGENKNDKGGN